MRFAREGYPFIAVSLVLTVLLFLMGWAIAWPMLVVALFVLNFFRDPERHPPADPRAIVAPADGRVIKVDRIHDENFLGGEAILISIFMSPIDVHVNRNPIDGTVVEVRYKRGRYLRAYADEASIENEQNAVLVQDEAGRRICYVQVAGFVARRIVCHLGRGDRVRRGERYGMIRFGSRADIYLPIEAAPAVQVGQRTTAGETVLARWS